jgi:predicted HD phosphohydrolase
VKSVSRAEEDCEVCERHGVLPDVRSPLFTDAVLEPMRWHVEAKRFLCATEPGYEAALSPDSRRSLVLQGGSMSHAEQAAFAVRPFARNALRLRRRDDRANVAGLRTPPLARFLALARDVWRS